MKEDLVIYGAGGFAAGDLTWLIEDIISDGGEFNLIGFLSDDETSFGAIKNTYEVLGDARWLESHSEVACVIGIGVGSVRERIAERIKNDVKYFPTLIHPNVSLSRHSSIGEGSLILPGTLISGGCSIGNHVVVNLDCTIGHDVQIDHFATISPGVHLSGFTRVGKRTDIGTGSNVIQGIEIGADSIVGAGSTVIRNLPGQVTAVGAPAKIIKKEGKRV